MSRDEQLKNRWNKVVQILSDQFAEGDILDLDAIIYLIGVQELGQFKQPFKKDEKVNLMHIAICRLLEPYGFYEFDFVDKDGWPHYKIKEELIRDKTLFSDVNLIESSPDFALVFGDSARNKTCISLLESYNIPHRYVQE
jgi:hypothetical protein